MPLLFRNVQTVYMCHPTWNHQAASSFEPENVQQNHQSWQEPAGLWFSVCSPEMVRIRPPLKPEATVVALDS